MPSIAADLLYFVGFVAGDMLQLAMALIVLFVLALAARDAIR